MSREFELKVHYNRNFNRDPNLKYINAGIAYFGCDPYFVSHIELVHNLRKVGVFVHDKLWYKLPELDLENECIDLMNAIVTVKVDEPINASINVERNEEMDNDSDDTDNVVGEGDENKGVVHDLEQLSDDDCIQVRNNFDDDFGSEFLEFNEERESENPRISVVGAGNGNGRTDRSQGGSAQGVAASVGRGNARSVARDTVNRGRGRGIRPCSRNGNWMGLGMASPNYFIPLVATITKLGSLSQANPRISALNPLNPSHWMLDLYGFWLLNVDGCFCCTCDGLMVASLDS
ncbi:hypothetical protein M9H77_35816 [Catharanthus roseus]|uniref:Uncharacterized protein n=1 Tax=Catharanthus roseus TaxID=4058 RepID=A0ACB9ZSN8_CATRO|nr:hypothetical protein M9H77_35816 [Catharanthus roseus]